MDHAVCHPRSSRRRGAVDTAWVMRHDESRSTPVYPLWTPRANSAAALSSARLGIAAITRIGNDNATGAQRAPYAAPLRRQGREVRGGLLRELERGEPELERLARRLHMSPRSLQRRLQREGTSLKLLTAELRRELAVRHLGEPHESIGEIAFLLGFSEPSTFHRAFKRWTGMTPIEYREKHRIFGAPGP